MSNNEQKIKCPKCGESISIDDVLTHQIGEKIRKEIEVEQKTKEIEIANQKKALKEQTIKFEESKKNAQVEITKKVAEKLATERITLWKQAQTEAGKEKEAEKKMLEEQLAEKDIKLQKANDNELVLRKEKIKLEEDKESFEIEKQRQLDEERNKIIEDASKKATEGQKYIIAQLEKKLTDAGNTNEEMKRKLEQGSQQTQGEVLELELEDLLKAEFPEDEIVPVPKGKKGADVIQKISDRSGRLCGQIVWESKKTKAWSEGWIQKLKDDQRVVKADLAVIISNVLPTDVVTFAFRDGVWICDIKLAIALATALRMNLESINRERTMSVGKNEKMEVLYSYLTGVEFKQRVEAIVEAFSNMDEGLRKERMAYEKIWSEREKQIKKVITNTVGMYGDLSGLVTLPQIKALELPESKNGNEK
ncbi:MAG TPA: DUF2130 domain-containing protein [bacterium]|nr:DUF2130 domain-containing protein [bacterium]